jgi:hypothetical protein
MSDVKTRASVWNFFVVDENVVYARCNVGQCHQKIKRGKTARDFSTSPLINHLKSQHPEEYKSLHPPSESSMPFISTSSSSTGLSLSNSPSSPCVLKGQLTLAQSFERGRMLDANHSRAKEITKLLAEMIAVDCQPISMLTDVGFTRFIQYLEPRYTIPSYRNMTEVVLPNMQKAVKERIQGVLKLAEAMSFTSDIWTSDVSNLSYISLTVHFIADDFQPHIYVLHNQHLEGSHDHATISTSVKGMLNEWDIPLEKVACFVTDSAANMKKAIYECGFQHKGCFAHSLQLAIHQSLLCQRAIIDALAVCRKIVGHFSHSPKACSKLKEIQEQLNLPSHKLLNDVATRWNSTLYMVERLCEQKMALAMYAAIHDITLPTTNQWDLLEKLRGILSPCEELTKDICRDDTTLSMAYPGFQALKRHLISLTNDQGVQSFKNELIQSLDKRFGALAEDPLIIASTLLDPRFKTMFFSSEQTEVGKSKILTGNMPLAENLVIVESKVGDIT